MMKIQPRLILAACFVNFGFVPAEPDNQIENQVITSKVHDDREIRKKFQNLFESISKKDTEKIEMYRDVLKEELFNERQTFDEMKTELRIAQRKNSKNKQNFYTKINHNSNILVAKREAIGNDRTDILLLDAEENERNANPLLARNITCARVCKKVLKLLPNMTRFDTQFHHNVSLAQKNRLMELSYNLFELEFRVSEVKEALQTVQNETACRCPRIRDKVEKIDVSIDEGHDALVLRFDDIKRNPDLQD